MFRSDWLSKRAEKEFRAIFKDSASVFVKKRGRVGSLAKSVCFWFFLAPITIISIREMGWWLFPWFLMRIQAITHLWIHVTGQEADAMASILLTVPLALVGLVIPLLVLVVSVVIGRINPSLVRHYFRIRKPQTMIFLALFVLGMEVCFLATQRFVTEFPDSFLDVGTELLVYLTIELILLAGLTVAKAIKSIDPSVIFEVSREVLQRLVGESLVEEIKRNIGWGILEAECKGLGIEVGLFAPSGGHEVKIAKKGVITDIDLAGLREANKELIKGTVSEESSVLKVRQTFMELVEDDDTIACISGQATPRQIDAASKNLQRSYKVGSLSNKNELRDTLSEFKTLAIEFCRVGDEQKMRLVMKTYTDIFREYLQLGLRLPKDAQPGIFGDWIPIALILNDLGDIIEGATQSSNRTIIDNMTSSFGGIMREALDNKEEYLLSTIARLFITVYRFSKRAGSELGLHRSYNELLWFFDYDLFQSIHKDTDIDKDSAVFITRIAGLIYETLHRIIRATVAENDFETFKELHRLLKPKKLFDYSTLRLGPDIIQLRHKLEQKTEGTQEWQQLKDKHDAAKLVYDLPFEYESFYKDQLILSLSYFIKFYQDGRKTQAQVAPFANLIFQEIGSVNSCLDFIERIGRGLVRDTRLWDPYMVVVREVISYDPMHLPLFVFCLRSLYEQAASYKPLDIAPSEALSSRFEQVCDLANKVTADNEKWAWLVGSISQNTLDSFRQAVLKSKEKHDIEVAEFIRAARLSPEKENQFKIDLKKAYDERVAVRPFLQSMNLVFEVSELQGDSGQVEKLHILSEHFKEAFIEQDKYSYYHVGRHTGDHVAQQEDFLIVRSIYSNHSLISLSPGQEDSLPELLEQAIGLLRPHFNPTLILVPFIVNVHYTLGKSPKFVETFKTRKHHRAIGIFDNTPVYEYQDDNANTVLVGDFISGIEKIEFTELTIQVRPLNEDEKKFYPEPNKAEERVMAEISETLRTTLREPRAFVKFEIANLSV